MQRLYTCDEIAKMFSVKVPTVWQWIRQKRLPAYKFGRTYQVSDEQIQVFMANCNTTQ